MTQSRRDSIMGCSQTMTSIRTISYAPGSLRSSISDSPSHARPEWTLCRNLDVFPIRDSAMLERWTSQGRVRSDDYLINHALDLCVQARDVAELDAIFRKGRAGALSKIGRGFACAALPLLWLIPLFGGLLLVSAMAVAVLSWWTASHHPAYRLSTAGQHDIDGRGNDRRMQLTARTE